MHPCINARRITVAVCLALAACGGAGPTQDGGSGGGSGATGGGTGGGAGGGAGGGSADAGSSFPSNSIITPDNHKTNATDTCASWQVIGAPIRLSTCSYANGGSGYSVTENTGTVAADICFTISYNAAGKTPSNDCRSNLLAAEVSRASCFSCGASNGGARAIDLTKYTPR